MNDKENNYYDLITDLAPKIQQLKGYETGYTRPKEGMIINRNGVNYIVEFNCIGEGDVIDAVGLLK